MSLDVINERSTAVVTVAFKDEDGIAVVPTAARYRLDCVTSNRLILEATSITPLASSVDLTITSLQNALEDSGHPYEERRLAVDFDYGTDKRGTAEYAYKLKNLPGIP